MGCDAALCLFEVKWSDMRQAYGKVFEFRLYLGSGNWHCDVQVQYLLCVIGAVSELQLRCLDVVYFPSARRLHSSLVQVLRLRGFREQQSNTKDGN